MENFDVMEYRQNLINYGKRFANENPDNFSRDEIEAVLAEIFYQLNKIDEEIGGFPHHETGLRCPKSITKDRKDILFNHFADWYQLLNTPSQAVFNYVVRHYPVEQFKKILCVGDGEKCHLGRKLAIQGYEVLSIDPEADSSLMAYQKAKYSKATKCKFSIATQMFSENSHDLINWADLIVGSKIPPIIETLLRLDKPSVFTSSENPETYHMKFHGIPVTSADQFNELIKKVPGVKAATVPMARKNGGPYNIFVYEGRDRTDLETPEASSDR